MTSRGNETSTIRPRVNMAQAEAAIAALRIALDQAPPNDKRIPLWEELDIKFSELLTTLTDGLESERPQYTYIPDEEREPGTTTIRQPDETLEQYRERIGQHGIEESQG